MRVNTGQTLRTIDIEPSPLHIAATPHEVRKGFSGLSWIGPDEAMLFLLRERESFWMKGMLVPLDIMWLDTNMIVTYMLTDVPPCGDSDDEHCPSYLPDVEFVAVLETAAGFCAKHGIQVGDRLSIGGAWGA